MVYLTVCMNVLDGADYDEVYQAAKEVEHLTNQEEGCIYFHVYPSSREKRQIMMWEIWKDKAAIEVNQRASYRRAFAAKKLVKPEFGMKSEVEIDDNNFICTPKTQ